MALSNVFRQLEMMIAAQVPTDQKAYDVLSRIGMLIVARAKINATRMGIVDRGHLRASIQYRIIQHNDNMTLMVGSFGVPYAAMNHFGGPVSKQQIRRMFVELRKRGPRRAGKGIVTISKSGHGFWRARPFLSDAIKQSRGDIVQLLKEAYG